MRKRDARKIYKRCGLKGIDFSKVGRLIGEGAHGCAYRYGKDKVIKFSEPEYNKSLQDMKELISVAKRFKALPKIYACNGCDEIYWVIMEYLPREPKIRDIRAITILDGVVLGYYSTCKLPPKWKSIGRSLMRLAKRGYRHQDIQFNNVRFTRCGEPKVIDLESFLF